MLLERKEGFIRYALDESGQRQGAVFLGAQSRYVPSTCWQYTRLQARRKSVADHLIDSVLQEYAEKEKLFDFEGSMIPGIAEILQQLRCTGGEVSGV